MRFNTKRLVYVFLTTIALFIMIVGLPDPYTYTSFQSQLLMVFLIIPLWLFYKDNLTLISKKSFLINSYSIVLTFCILIGWCAVKADGKGIFTGEWLSYENIQLNLKISDLLGNGLDGVLPSKMTMLLLISALLAQIPGLFILINMCLQRVASFSEPLEYLKERKSVKRKYFFIFMGIILTAWLPYYIAYFPGIVSADALWQIRQALGYSSLSSHHPISHTFLIKVFFSLGMLFSQDLNLGAAFYTVFQMLAMSATFAYSVYWLYKKGVSKKWLILALLIYALHPINAYYSIYTTKDSLAGSMLLLYIIFLADYVIDAPHPPFKNLAFLLIVISVGVLRSNTFYVIILMLPVIAIFFYRKKTGAIAASVAGVIISFLIISPLADFLGAQKINTVFTLSIPLQQMSRVVAVGGEVAPSEAELLENLLPLEEIKKKYYPLVADNIIYAMQHSGNEISNNKLEYLQLWSSLGLKNLGIYADAYIYSTYGYYYPRVLYWAIGNYIPANNLDIHFIIQNPILRNIIFCFYGLTLGAPIIGMIWGIGFHFFLAMLCIIICFVRRNSRMILPFIPIVLTWLSLLASTPVYAQARYGYIFFIALPVILFFPFLKKQQEVTHE